MVRLKVEVSECLNGLDLTDPPEDITRVLSFVKNKGKLGWLLLLLAFVSFVLITLISSDCIHMYVCRMNRQWKACYYGSRCGADQHMYP